MARLFVTHFEKFDIIKQFHDAGIKAVINLEQQGEHAFCGAGLSSSGFSYEPEELMKNNIFYFNYPLPDFGSCSKEHLLDIAKVAKNALASGKLAIHCHAGHGRTGMVIAAIVMYTKNMTAFESVKLVRSKRSQSVQSISQVDTLNQFEQLIFENATKYRNRQFSSIKEFVKFSTWLLSKAESRIYGLIPKVVYVTCPKLLEEFYDEVRLELATTENLEPTSFKYRLGAKKNDIIIKEEHLLLLKSERLRAINVGRTLNQEENIPAYVTLVGVLDDFLMNNFHQLCSSAELISSIESEDCETVKDWQWTLNLLISTGTQLPTELQSTFAQLCSMWFCRKSDSEEAIHNSILRLSRIVVE
ncbi:unnamed protein product [Auanema sp. JU1783]|nr:unnamed protein product [Auanema sp. JU1783]